MFNYDFTPLIQLKGFKKIKVLDVDSCLYESESRTAAKWQLIGICRRVSCVQWKYRFKTFNDCTSLVMMIDKLSVNSGLVSTAMSAELLLSHTQRRTDQVSVCLLAVVAHLHRVFPGGN